MSSAHVHSCYSSVWDLTQTCLNPKSLLTSDHCTPDLSRWAIYCARRQLSFHKWCPFGKGSESFHWTKCIQCCKVFEDKIKMHTAIVFCEIRKNIPLTIILENFIYLTISQSAFLDGPVAGSWHLHCRCRVQFLLRELRSYMPRLRVCMLQPKILHATTRMEDPPWPS